MSFAQKTVVDRRYFHARTFESWFGTDELPDPVHGFFAALGKISVAWTGLDLLGFNQLEK